MNLLKMLTGRSNNITKSLEKNVKRVNHKNQI